ncbi:uncharacterized protein F5891DRAFT_1175124 [Suillus fuscotomentosus]|uniref:Uncharacterized protein n=1 Tax=Suillus fuscotomentosus TaxID=1912939 RepID=A0AAD4DYY9_9AGAM|nr:uncharacterized protein F5891DRAFT_1175124 [Suillus fuscotomentosus]KAG1896542.1 hypothetical protein F5891DRAFT_1175124 [Suillus fuscotomentosus]
MSNHQALVETLLMKSILGQELVNTKFHMFSGRRSTNLLLEDEEEVKANHTPPSDVTTVLEGNISESEDHEDDDSLVVADTMCESDALAGPPQVETLITLTPIHINHKYYRNFHTRARHGIENVESALAQLYLYTDKISFSPLKSQGPPKTDAETPNPSTSWPCSPKSMYRLASKVRLDSLRDQAFRAIRSSLDAGNILQELSSSFTSKYPAILQMNVEVLLQHIASIPVIQNIPSLLRRINDSQLPHGADIIIDLYQKFLLQYHPQAFALANAPIGSTSPPQRTDSVLNTPIGSTSPPQRTDSALNAPIGSTSPLRKTHNASKANRGPRKNYHASYW